MLFREFVEQKRFVEFVTSIINEDIQAGGIVRKPWSAKKTEVMAIWKNLRPDLPIYMTPMSDDIPFGKKNHSSYSEDGVRITGSWQFIASILARLKEISHYENPNTKLRIVFRGVDYSRIAQPNKQAFAFYVNLEPRKKK